MVSSRHPYLFDHHKARHGVYPHTAREWGDKINCFRCGKLFKQSNQHRKYCSVKCRGGKLPFQKTCQRCDRLFWPRRHQQRFCSHKCSFAHYAAPRRVPSKICLHCQKKLIKRAVGMYCSRVCSDAAKYVVKLCKRCGTPIPPRKTNRQRCISSRSDRTYCSRACMARAFTKRKQYPCTVCGKLSTNTKFCSRRCRAIKAWQDCPRCGKPFRTDGHRGRVYCSMECRFPMRGERKWLRRGRQELQRVKRLLREGIPQRVSGSPRRGSPPHSNSPP